MTTRSPLPRQRDPEVGGGGGLALPRHRTRDEEGLDRFAQRDQPQAGAQTAVGLGGPGAGVVERDQASAPLLLPNGRDLREHGEPMGVAGDVFRGLDLVVEELGEKRQREAEHEAEHEAQEHVTLRRRLDRRRRQTHALDDLRLVLVRDGLAELNGTELLRRLGLLGTQFGDLGYDVGRRCSRDELRGERVDLLLQFVDVLGDSVDPALRRLDLLVAPDLDVLRGVEIGGPLGGTRARALRGDRDQRGVAQRRDRQTAHLGRVGPQCRGGGGGDPARLQERDLGTDVDGSAGLVERRRLHRVGHQHRRGGFVDLRGGQRAGERHTRRDDHDQHDDPGATAEHTEVEMKVEFRTFFVHLVLRARSARRRRRTAWWCSTRETPRSDP